jgi:putative endonuclease
MLNPQTNTRVGRHAEDVCAAYLNLVGLRVLERNWRFSRLEVDAVVEDGRTIVIVEAKYRSGTSFGGPAAAVGVRKQRFLEAAAIGYLKMRKLRRPVRFDVVAMTRLASGLDIKHIRGAFEASGRYRI